MVTGLRPAKREPKGAETEEALNLEPYFLTGTPLIAMLTNDFRQVFESMTLFLERFYGRDAAGPG